MKFLRAMEQNDICNLLLTNMEKMQTGSSVITKIGGILLFLRYHHYIHVQFLNN